ncbi:MAG: hypothetical protein U5K71_14895 [Gracilimonas sp.]|nr:hypothetical protein [Gracilimonas sp.]
MNNRAKILVATFITMLIFIGIACQPQQSQDSVSETETHMDSDEDYANTVPLIYHMSFIQRYSTKLYFAGLEENWGLADIYAHELEELSEVISEGNMMDDGIDISNLMETMLPPELEKLEEAIDNKNLTMFKQNYENMIQTCNQCHQAADYGLVKITIPKQNPFNQDFSAPSE